MKYEYLIFDLDGTISDPKDGIVKCLNHALSSHSFPIQDEEELSTYIGPPLDSTFKAITNSDNTDLIASLVTKYRERYSEIGYSENVIYKGIPEILETLASISKIKLGICTSKREDFARKILDLFGLTHYFCFINGGDVGIEKWQQLGYLLDNCIISSQSVMIGDRYIDITAAQKNKLSAAGVLWGYGSHSELSEHKPSHLFTKPCELESLAA